MAFMSVPHVFLVLPDSERRSRYTYPLDLRPPVEERIDGFAVKALSILDGSIREPQVAVFVYAGLVDPFDPLPQGPVVRDEVDRDVREDAFSNTTLALCQDEPSSRRLSNAVRRDTSLGTGASARASAMPGKMVHEAAGPWERNPGRVVMKPIWIQEVQNVAHAQNHDLSWLEPRQNQALARAVRPGDRALMHEVLADPTQVPSGSLSGRMASGRCGYRLSQMQL